MTPKGIPEPRQEPGMWPADYQPSPTSWVRCCSCGLAVRIGDADELGHGRYVHNAATASPLCHRRRQELNR